MRIHSHTPILDKFIAIIGLSVLTVMKISDME